MTTSTLLPMLCISIKFTTTSCSKVPQGLHFPLGVSGLCTGKYFQRAPFGDSDNLVKPFMRVAIHTTRHYATLSFLLLSFLSEERMKISHFLSFSKKLQTMIKFRRSCANKTLHISMQFGLYLHNYKLCLTFSL